MRLLRNGEVVKEFLKKERETKRNKKSWEGEREKERQRRNGYWNHDFYIKIILKPFSDPQENRNDISIS